MKTLSVLAASAASLAFVASFVSPASAAERSVSDPHGDTYSPGRDLVHARYINGRNHFTAEIKYGNLNLGMGNQVHIYLVRNPNNYLILGMRRLADGTKVKWMNSQIGDDFEQIKCQRFTTTWNADTNTARMTFHQDCLGPHRRGDWRVESMVSNPRMMDPADYAKRVWVPFA